MRRTEKLKIVESAVAEGQMCLKPQGGKKSTQKAFEQAGFEVGDDVVVVCAATMKAMAVAYLNAAQNARSIARAASYEGPRQYRVYGNDLAEDFAKCVRGDL